MYVLPSVPWPSLTSIMNYPLCMTHDLATAYHHDHAWTENWAHNICKLSMPMSIVRLLSNPREHRQRSRLYKLHGTCKNYPPQHALLNVGFMTILRRTDCFILKWTCSAVLAVSRNCHFQIAPASKRHPHKNKNVVLFCCHVLPRNDAFVKLYGRSHPAPKLLRGWSAFRVMDPVGVRGRRGTRVSARFMASKV
jgi:hypothetical protein